MPEPTDAVIDQPSAPAAPSSAPAAPAAEDARSPLTSLTADERQAWDRDGKLPDRVAEWKKPAAQPSAPATGDDAPAVDATGQPILDNGKPISKRDQRINDLVRRGVESARALDRQEIDALQRKLAEVEDRTAPPAAEPTNQPPAEDTEPTIEDFPIDQFLDKSDPYGAQLAAYARALNKFDRQQEQKVQATETAQRTAQQRAVDGLVKTFESYQARETAFKATAPDFDSKTLQIRQQLNPTSPLAQALLDSPVGPQLVLHLAEHPDDFERIGRLGMVNLPAALREIGRLEARYDPPASAASAPPASPPISDAPAMGTVLGSRPAPAADEGKAAIARGDFRTFDEIETQKELARRRR